MIYTHTPTTTAIPVQDTQQLFPVNRIYCVGRNYVAHAQEMGFTGREAPFFFIKPADTLLIVAPEETGAMPYPSLTQDLQHEIEWVICIGKGGKNICAANAAQHIFGYAIGLDMTRRDLQAEQKKQGRPWEIGKVFEAAAPISHIIRANAAPDIAHATIELWVNGQPRQSSTLQKLIWNASEIIEHLSKIWALQAGDLIYTGTPEGVAAVKSGDVMTGSITGLGQLRVQVV